MALPSARLVKRKKDVMKACATFCDCTVAAVLPLCFCNYASAAALRHLDCAALGMTMRHDN